MRQRRGLCRITKYDPSDDYGEHNERLAQGIWRDVLHRAFLAVGGTIGDGTSVVTIDDNDAVGMTRAIDRFAHGGDTMHSGGATADYALPMVRNSAIHL